MAASTPPLVSAPALSQKQRRALLRKDRRKRKRQALAQARQCDVPDGDNGILEAEEEDEEEENEEDRIAQEERQRLHEEWLERERRAQVEFSLRTEREEAARKRKEEEERLIKEEWEAQQKREEEDKEQKQQEKRDREEAVQKMLDEAENQLDNGPWMNPEAPVRGNSENYGTEQDVANCPFFLKTGACRFGDRCSRKHAYPTTTPTLMIRGMFTTFGMEESRRDDYDIDACLEHSEEELHEYFIDFYHDVLAELRSVGRVVQFKISRNYEPHLRGNVYVQFEREEQCREAFIKFNGRWYAGKQLHCELCPVTRWKNAICGLFDRQKCPKGKHCNFLHVFRNPGNEFWEADRDLHLSPVRSVRGGRNDGWHSERYRERYRGQRHCSRSPPRSERSRGRPEGDRWRSRSRSRERSQERRTSHQQRDKRLSRSRHGSRRKERYRSRSRERSRSTERERDRRRNRSKEKEADKYCRPNEEKDRPHHKDTDTHHREEGDGFRSKSREMSNNMSPKKPDRDKSPSEEISTRRHHKHSKKNKKKSKKKHKKKSHLSEEMTSSGESDKEKDLGEGTGEKVMEKNCGGTSPGQDINEAELIQTSEGINEALAVESKTKCSPQVKEQISEEDVPSEPVGNGDTEAP